MPPDQFWVQSPRSFVTIMEGRASAAKRQADMNIALAWHTAVFAVRAYGGKLDPLAKYLGIKPKAQSADEMLAILRGVQARGASMNIKTVN